MAKEFAANRYSEMKYRRCGRSGIDLPMISLGLWQALGEPGQEEECRKSIFYAFDHGITHFDLANNYGPPPGNSELVAGKIFKDMPRDELIISTKAGFGMWEGPYGDGGSKKYLVASLDQSLKRMGLEYVDIFYHHRPDDSTPLEETFEALDLIVKQGKALYTGVSNYDGMHFNNALKVIEKRGLSPITIHQPYYNLLSPGPETDLFPYTANNGTGVIAFCPLAGGQLTDRYLGGLPSDSREGKRGVDGQKWWNEFRASKKYEQIDGLNNLAKKRGQTLAQMSLAWVLRLPAVTSALIGASRHEQIAQNIETLKNLDFAPEEIAAIDQLRAL